MSLTQSLALSLGLPRPGAQRVGTPDHSVGFADPDAGSTAAVVVSDILANTVSVFSAKGKAVATITGFVEPQGLAGDKTGNIYIANTGSSNVVVYKKDYKTLVETLADVNQYPAGVSVSTKGLVAVTNLISTSNGAGSVSIYKAGATTPCVTISDTNFAKAYFDAFDAKGDLYVDGLNSLGAFVVGEIPAASCTSQAITSLTTGNSVGFPGGIEVTKSGEVAIDDQAAGSIYTYNTPVAGSLGTPVTTTPLTGAGDAVTFSFTSTLKTVWDADGDGTANSFAYPAGGSPISTIRGFQYAIGVLAIPAQIP